MDNTHIAFIRLFFAVMPDDNVKERLVKLIHSLKGHHARWTKPDNLHLTLRFIGNTPQDKIPQLIQSVQQRIALYSTHHTWQAQTPTEYCHRSPKNKCSAALCEPSCIVAECIDCGWG